MPKVTIGVGGSKEVGKDTSAKVLIEKYGFRRFAFADPLKELCAEAFDMSLYDLHDPIKKERPFFQPFVINGYYANQLIEQLKKHITLTEEQVIAVVNAVSGKSFDTPRHILQYVGTDVIRKYVSDSFWVDLFHKNIKDYDKVIITDMRFPNERKFVRETMNGKLLLIKRNKFKKKESNHASETSLGSEREYDKVIDNDKKISDLQEQVEDFYICSVKGLEYTPKRVKFAETLLGFFRTLKSLVPWLSGQ